MTRFRKSPAALVFCAATLVCLLTVGAPHASADSISFNVGNANLAISGFTGPFATVTVTMVDSTHATITFTSDTATTGGGGDCTAATPCTYLMGDGSSIALNVNATSFDCNGTVGCVGGTLPTESNSLGGSFSASPKDYSSGNVDGFGTFNLTVDNNDGFFKSATSVSFTLSNDSGTWASAANVLTPNAGGSTAAVHVFVESASCTSGGALSACATGFAANGAAVPEPASMGLLGTALLGAYGLLCRKLRAE